MKIELEIDDKYKNSNLYILCGPVPIARYKWTKGFWEIKTEFCKKDGECCKSENTPFYIKQLGQCEYLKTDPGNGVICSLKNMRPVGCSTATSKLENCRVIWSPA